MTTTHLILILLSLQATTPFPPKPTPHSAIAHLTQALPTPPQAALTSTSRAEAAPGFPPLPSPARWPLDPPFKIARPFAPPDVDWLPGHRGIDLQAPAGSVILSPAPGTITHASPVATRGVLTLTHGPYRTTYEPVTPLLPKGTTVPANHPIALLSPAPTHCPPTPCLHWGLLLNQPPTPTYLDPRLLPTPPPVILLPTPTPPPPAQEPH
ncbi:M23 family metallopeptidase [Actinocorallia sp. API 0066]|uniref:M23 family metallopeptidase n=1 Tax=Actinocorallia sp. API 0066 TaxID=2896846 RepID=UPI001E3367AF|nr:M23 family metallopeptidase [Actinocorallia sp. API 0066]MCD0448417.1 M23 family metallopeptidase [Actinocorallia sp. API 0066]